jgi:hypothetical protein
MPTDASLPRDPHVSSRGPSTREEKLRIAQHERDAALAALRAVVEAEALDGGPDGRGSHSADAIEAARILLADGERKR